MIEIDFNSENKIKFKYQDPDYKNIQREYRRNYYQKNKEKISKYQKEYYYKKMGYDRRKVLNWKGEKCKGMTIQRGVFVVRFD